MPPRKQIEKEAILARAFELARTEGFDAITARSLAASLKCSTQPIYQSFADRKALQSEVALKSASFMLETIQSRLNAELPAELAYALEYVRFALEEKRLFQLIARAGLFGPSAGLADASAPTFDPRLVIFANGVVFLTAYQAEALPWERARALITEAYRAFKLDSEEERRKKQ